VPPISKDVIGISELLSLDGIALRTGGQEKVRYVKDRILKSWTRGKDAEGIEKLL
jgi:hypothetical protein